MSRASTVAEQHTARPLRGTERFADTDDLEERNGPERRSPEGCQKLAGGRGAQRRYPRSPDKLISRTPGGVPEHNDHKMGELNAPIVERNRNLSRHLPEICGRKMCHSSGGQFWHPSRVRFGFDGVPGVSLTLNPRLPSGRSPGCRTPGCVLIWDKSRTG